MWHAFAGSAFSNHLALKVGYSHLPNTTLFFAAGEMYHADMQAFSMTSKTDLWTFSGQLMLPMPGAWQRAYLYSQLGAALTHRRDELAKLWHWGALFGGGVGYNVSERCFAELGFQYTTGSGKAAIKPAYTYMPFAYAVDLRLAYRF